MELKIGAKQKTVAKERADALDAATAIYNKRQKLMNGPQVVELSSEDYLADLIDRLLDGLGLGVAADNELTEMTRATSNASRERLGLKRL